MFSPDVSLPSTAHHLRPKRSRRQGSEESIKLPLAKKRRSALRRDTFEPLKDGSIDHDSGSTPNGNVQSKRQAPEDKTSTAIASARPTELTFRGGKKVEKRSERPDGSFVLSSNDYYSVAQLPALPDQIRSHSSTSFSSVIAPENGYALALTHSHALIWPYNSPAHVPPSKDTFSFPLPFSIPPSEPLPLAAFTAGLATKEPGLVVVTPGKGKIAYWETISSASALVPDPTAHGVQGSVPGMFTGETITSVVNAEPAGFILTFSHGRVAHLTLKDQLGRPAVGVQFLRKVPSGAHGGLFGNIRNVFGGSGRKNIAAAKAGKSSRGQRDVMIVTEDADIELWDTRLSVGNSLKYQLSARDDLLESLNHNLPADRPANFQFSVLDCAFSARASNNQQVAKLDGDSYEEVSFLVALTHIDQANYYIVESSISPDSVKINVVHPITCYKKPVRNHGIWRPKLYLPRPGQTAFIIFETAIVLFSLARLKESPSSQLLLEGGSSPEPFQDCIRFQEDSSFIILGSGSEDQNDDHKHPSCVLSVQSFGVVRVSVTSAQTVTDDTEEAKVTAKSKIEQAIFFGNLRNNPLDLVSHDDNDFPFEQIESAALEISQDILTSRSKYLPKATPSVEQNLRTRAKVHEDLALHLSKHYNPLRRPARFQLLWDAEKLAAQRAMWKVEEEHRKRRPKDEETVLQNILFYLHPDYKTQIDQSKGENDRVRHWFTFDANRINNVTLWFNQVHVELYKDEVTEPKLVSENLLETIELFIAMYETAYRFREDNAALYGLGDETFKEGMLTAGYGDLPQPPWTCKEFASIIKLVNTSKDFAHQWWVNESKSSSPSPSTVRKIGSSLPRQTDLESRMILEKAKWLGVQDSEEKKRERDALQAGQRMTAREQLVAVAALGFSNDAIELAEKFQDMDLLVELNVDAVVQLHDQLTEESSQKENDRVESEEKMINDRMDSYFDQFKNRWAQAFYERMIQNEQLGTLLNDEDHQEYLTRFLRKKPQYGKISWINDIVGERSFSKASETLALIAESQETNHWSKKVEYCLSKLATLAVVEHEAKVAKLQPRPTDEQLARISATTSAISLLDLQNQVYLHVTSLIGRNVLDLDSRRDLAFDVLGKNSAAVKDKPANKGLLYDGLGLLLRRQSMSVDQLVDVLTLMFPIATAGPADPITEETIDASVIGNEFFFALKAIDFAFPHANDEGINTKTKRDALHKIVWRRVMIRDDWEDLNKTASKSEEDVMTAMKGTATWHTATQILEEQFLDDLSTTSTKTIIFQKKPTNIHIPTPTEILDSPIFPECLQSRFAAQELELVRKDLEAENQQLQDAVEKGRLEIWFPGLLREVKEEVIKSDEDRLDASDAAVVEEAVQLDAQDGVGENQTGDVEMEQVSAADADNKGLRRSVRFASQT